MGEVAHDGGQSVPGVHVEYLPGLHGPRVGTHQHLVVVRDVLPGQAIVSHLVQLRGGGGTGVQVQETVNPREKVR